MAQTVRIEFVKMGGGGQQVSPDQGVKSLIGTPVIVPVTGVATAGGARPQAPTDTYVAVRLTAQGGAAYVAWGDDPTATDSNSVVLVPGAPPFLITSVRGAKFSFLAANLDPLPVSVKDLTVAADTVNLNTSDLESLISTTNTNLGAKTDAVATTDTGSFSLISLFKRLLQNWTSGLSVFTPATKIVSAVQTVTSGAAYAAGNCIGGKMTFSGITRANDISALLQQVAVNCKSNQTGAMDLVLFSADPSGSTIADKTNLSIAAADFDKVAGVLHITDWTSLGTPSIGQALNAALPFKPAAGTTTVYGALVARATPTFASTSDVSVTLRAMGDG